MNTLHQRRRLILKAGVGLAGAAALGGVRTFADSEVRLRTFWWGSQDRARRTNEVGKLYEKRNKGVTVVGEVGSGPEYWTKLATQMAARNISDVFQLEPNSLSDYAQRGACRAMDEFIPKPLDINSFGSKTKNLCRVNGKIYGVGLGLNSFCLLYDTGVFAQAGIPVPTHRTTWAQFADLSVALTKASKRDGYWAAPYGARYDYVLDIWLRQRGKSVYTEDGKLGFNVDDAKEWFTYWEDLRRRGGCVTADIQTLDQNNIETSALAMGKAAMALAFSNQLVGYQLVVKNQLGLTMVPSSGKSAKSGHYYRPALIWSIASSTKYPEKAADFINFFVNDVEAGKILGVERGVPLSPKVRAAVLPTINRTEKATVDYINFLEKRVSAYPAPAPVGAGEFNRNALRPASDMIAFGKASIAEGAKMFVENATAVISKNRNT